MNIEFLGGPKDGLVIDPVSVKGEIRLPHFLKDAKPLDVIDVVTYVPTGRVSELGNEIYEYKK